MKLKAIVHEDENGGYWAEVPALPGCATQGDTMKELRANLKEAAAGCLESIEAMTCPTKQDRLIEVVV